jgi:MoaA/NifB/PqqE/SkfB family radical SAM enzyme
MSDRLAIQRELSVQEYERILQEIVDAGCLWLLFTGGEIFARRDFLDIYRIARFKGLLVTLFTNGTMITPAIADSLAAEPPFCIEITLYGRTKDTYEKLTGVPGSYDRCLRGIHLLKERKLPLKLKTVAVSINKHEIGAMKEFVEDELGLEFKFDAMINPRIDCSQSPIAVRLKPHEVVQLDLDDPRRTSEWNAFQQKFGGVASQPDHGLYHCGGGMNSFAIDPYGLMSICVLSQKDKYDLRQGSFAEGWTKFLHNVRVNKKISMLTKCFRCGIKAMCGMCPANGELESGHPEKPVDFLCHTAHLRARVFGMEIPEHGCCEYCAGGSRVQELEFSLAQVSIPVSHSQNSPESGSVCSTSCACGS